MMLVFRMRCIRMEYDYKFFLRRYNSIEENFLEITDFIALKNNFEEPCYSIGSSKLMDFCLKVGTEVETLFRLILDNSKFDEIDCIGNNRNHQNIDIYREIIEPKYQFSEIKLHVNPIKIEIKPFEDFHTKKPEWFGIYSKYKHNKIQLIDKWNLKHSLYALGCLLILVLNHPNNDDKRFIFGQLSDKVFKTYYLIPNFSCGGIG